MLVARAKEKLFELVRERRGFQDPGHIGFSAKNLDLFELYNKPDANTHLPGFQHAK